MSFDPPSPRVWNRRDPLVPDDAVYIGRPSKWGNPFMHRVHGTRAQVIAKYRVYLSTTTQGAQVMLDAQRELKGKHLVCYCAPLPCHGDVLLEIANS